MNDFVKKAAAVLSLSGVERFEYFVKKVVDEESAWGLYADGWALAGDAEGKIIFPLWPESGFAEMCATGDWAAHRPEMIDLEDLLNELLPRLEADGIAPGVFLKPNRDGVTPSVRELVYALNAELERY